MNPDRMLTLSLISHTNVGKTTLARTLLRRDVGEVADQEHITIENIKYTLVETENGEALRLWDTPGFGDSVQLLKRLERQRNPIGWLLNETWDRFANRSLWCSQQAVANVRDEADVVLYLVNAVEAPDGAGYVRPEMRVLEWVGKPVIILLNQTGDASDVSQYVKQWRVALEPFAMVRDVISLDAFTRCWVQEGELLKRVGKLLPDKKAPAQAALLGAWMARHAEIFTASMAHLTEHLLDAASTEIAVDENRGRDDAQKQLADRLARSRRTMVDQLLVAHSIDGKSDEAKAVIDDEFDGPAVIIDAGLAGVIGGAVSGAASGLTADFLAGGFTFLGGAVIGALAGGLSAAGLVGAFKKLFAGDDQHVTWTAETLDGEAQAAVMRYLAVAHFGRGRGVWKQPQQREHWKKHVVEKFQQRTAAFHDIWQSARDNGKPGEQLHLQLQGVVGEVLAVLYPDAKEFIPAAGA